MKTPRGSQERGLVGFLLEKYELNLRSKYDSGGGSNAALSYKIIEGRHPPPLS